MSVFLSYSHKDEAVALLLAFILKEKGVDCLVDQRLHGGEQLDHSIQTMIRQCDLVLVLLTESAVNSPWVNQEIGFAAGCGKAIWPLAVQREITPAGMLGATSSYSLFNWASAAETLEKLVSALKNPRNNTSSRGFPSTFGLDHVVHGKLERRYVYLSRLHDILANDERPLDVYLQAAFSHFAASDLEKDYEGQSDEEKQIAIQQKRALLQLCQRPRTRLRLLIWPERNYSKRELAARFGNLLSWMRSSVSEPNIMFLYAKYLGPNRLVVQDHFCIEGYKHHPTAGYDLTIVKYGKSDIDAAIKEFMDVYDNAVRSGNSKQKTIEIIAKMHQQANTADTE